jgi:hypothetical protein
MRKISLLLICICAFNFLCAQVKIGAPGDPDLNAVLELTGPKGLLLPRVSLTGTTDPAPLSAHTAGMVVYNTATAGDIKPGYYYNDGVKWLRITNGGETWSLNGNSGTNNATDFIGTIDSVDFKIRTSNLNRIRIAAAGWIEIGTSSLPNRVQLKIGGTISGDSSAALGIDPIINATDDNQTLYSFRNNPHFGTSFLPSQVIGSATEFEYSGAVQGFLTSGLNSVRTTGTNSYPGVVSAVFGMATRSSSGTNDGSYYGGYFRSSSSGGSGTVNESWGVFSNAQVTGSTTSNVYTVGGHNNLVSIFNPNAAVGTVYGLKNVILHSTNSEIFQAYGLYNQITANLGGNTWFAYGNYIRIGTSGASSSIGSAYGLYINDVDAGSHITDYRGIYLPNFVPAAGFRRPFEYAGSGTNSPVIINYDGSVLIGTSNPVANTKLSVYNGHIRSGQNIRPTVVQGSAGGSAQIQLGNNATDVAGLVAITLNASTAAGQIAVINFNKPYSNPPIVIITPANLEASSAIVNQRPYVVATTSSFSIYFGAPGTVAPPMQFNYYVIEISNN